MACFAVLPTILPHRGDQRRNMQPYFVTGGITYGDLNVANWGADQLRKKGHGCHVAVMDDLGVV